MYLLDTNVVSELRKASFGKANQAVCAWAEQIPAASLYVSVITILELETGILMAERKDPVQGKALRSWLEKVVLTAFSGRILPFDLPTARRCAELHVPDRRPERDGFIAATAKTHGMTVVTRNTKDFVAIGVDLINPWEYAGEMVL